MNMVLLDSPRSSPSIPQYIKAKEGDLEAVIPSQSITSSTRRQNFRLLDFFSPNTGRIKIKSGPIES